MSLHRSLTMGLILTITIAAYAQPAHEVNVNKPLAGNPMPDFTLNNITHYKTKSASLKDFKGKWLFLDFWFMGCSSCIKSFPKINQLQQEFNDEVQFIMVGCIEKRSNQNIKDFYEKLRVKQSLNIAMVYDSILAQRWDINSMPHIVIIDPQGIVKYITDGRDMDSEKIQRLLRGETVTFYEKDLPRKDFGNVLNDAKLLYNSTLIEWAGETFNVGLRVDEYIASYKEKKSSFKFAGVNLYRLYNTAYFAQGHLSFVKDPVYSEIYPIPILETHDTTLFQYQNTSNYGKGLYNYSLYVPPSQVTEENIMKYMQEDLKRTFGFNASVEYRDMPVWKLIAKPEAEKKIKTKGGTTYNSALDGNAFTGFTVRNVPINDFTRFLFSYLNQKVKHPFIDNTGISFNIDLTINADMMNIQDVRKELHKWKLDLVKSTKKMKVLVIKD